MPHANYVAVLVAALSSVVLGAIWYSPLLFGRRWDRLAGSTVSEGTPWRRPSVTVIIFAFILNFVAAYMIAIFMPSDPVTWTVPISAAIGLAFVAGSIGTTYAFTSRPTGLWLIDGGYHVLRFALIGLILGFWH